MINLVDGDLLTYRAASSCEPTSSKPEREGKEIALYRLHDMIQTIVNRTNSTDMQIFISGENNFRKKIYPEYKANRTRPTPSWLQDCREILVTQYNATIVNDIETDDALGIWQTKYDGNSRIVSLDKDLLQVPGWHFQWEIRGTSVNGKQWVKPEAHIMVSPLDGLKTFYKQLILGDATDNIPGFDGKLRTVIPKFVQKHMDPLDEMTNEVDMYNHVFSVYFTEQGNDDIETIMNRNAQLLYILRNEDEYWQPPVQA